MGPTNPNRMYLWSGCVGNLSNLGPGGTDGLGAGPATYNGLSVNNAYWTFPTFPEVLDAAGVSWKIYQDLTGKTFAPDFGDGLGNGFVGNFTDNPLLYFNQYATAPTSSPLFQNACSGTAILNSIPTASATESAWLASFGRCHQSGKHVPPETTRALPRTRGQASAGDRRYTVVSGPSLSTLPMERRSGQR